MVATAERGTDEGAGMQTLNRTARVTGLWYLGLALTGVFGFMVVRPQLFVAADAAATLANLVEHTSLARVGVALELGIVLTQALTAIWFYRLFRDVAPVAAGSIAAFGLINAVAIMGSAALLGTAVDLAEQALGDAVGVQTLFLASGNLWRVGNLFFGLWLIRLDPRRRRIRLHPGRVPRLRGAQRPVARRSLVLAGGRGRVLDGRLPAPQGSPAQRDGTGQPDARTRLLMGARRRPRSFACGGTGSGEC
jgi:hypothetical protein